MRKLALIIWMLGLLSIQQAGAASGDVWLNLAATEVHPGDTIALQLLVDSGSVKLGGYELSVTFESSRLQLDTTVGVDNPSTSEEDHTGVELGANALGNTVVNISTPGEVFSTGADSSGKGPGANLHLLTINFTVLAGVGDTTVGLTVVDLIDKDENQITAHGIGVTVPVRPGIGMTQTLTVAKAGSGSGTVTSTPVGIDCGSDCSEDFAEGTVVTLHAAAIAGSVFAGWSGDADCTDGQVTMDAAKNCTATFTEEATQGGDVWLNPAGTEVYVGDHVTLQLLVDSGSVKLGGYELSVTFETSRLQLDTTVGVDNPSTSEEDHTGVELGADALGNTVVNISTPGEVFSTGADSSGKGPGANLHLLTVNFTAVAVGDTTVGLTVADLIDKDENQIARNNIGVAVVTVRERAGMHALTVTKTGTGTGTVTSTPAGIDCGSDCSEDYAENAVVMLDAAADAGSTFVGWSGDADCTDGQVTMDAAKNCTATFNTVVVPTYTLTVNKTGTGTGTVTSNPVGIDCGTDCTQDFPEGEVVTLITTPDANSLLQGWGGDCSAAGQVTMDGDKTCTATFNTAVVPTYTLTINKTGTGAGTVTSNPVGIDCGTDCTQDYDENTIVALTAAPAVGSSFAGWSGDADCTDGQVTMDAAKACTATFDTVVVPTYTLTVRKSGAGTGVVTSAPEGVDCGSDCTEAYAEGTVVTLDAAADAGSIFDGWLGALDCADGQVTINRDKTCIAAFSTPNAVLSILDATGAPEATADVVVAYKSDDTIVSMNFIVAYDQSLLTVSDVISGSADPHTVGWRVLEPGQLMLVTPPKVALPAIASANPFATVQFAIDASAPEGQAPITIPQVIAGNANGEAVPVSTVNGYVNIGVAAPGDANGDGEVNALDLIGIVNEILGNSTSQGNADCNGDGMVNSIDMICVVNLILAGS